MSEIMPVLILGGMVLIFIGTYWLNKRTPAPAIAMSDAEQAQCQACNLVTCSNHGGDK